MKLLTISLILFAMSASSQTVKPYEIPDGTITQVFKSIYNGETKMGTVGFAIKNDSKCTIRIYNSKRKQVSEIMVDKELTKGGWLVEYDASFLPEGTYYYTLIADNEEYTSIRWKVFER